MYEQVEKPKENKSRAVANSVAQKKSNGKQDFGFVDNRRGVNKAALFQASTNINSSQLHQPIQRAVITHGPINGLSRDLDTSDYATSAVQILTMWNSGNVDGLNQLSAALSAANPESHKFNNLRLRGFISLKLNSLRYFDPDAGVASTADEAAFDVSNPPADETGIQSIPGQGEVMPVAPTPLQTAALHVRSWQQGDMTDHLSWSTLGNHLQGRIADAEYAELGNTLIGIRDPANQNPADVPGNTATAQAALNRVAGEIRAGLAYLPSRDGVSYRAATSAAGIYGNVINVGDYIKDMSFWSTSGLKRPHKMVDFGAEGTQAVPKVYYIIQGSSGVFLPRFTNREVEVREVLYADETVFFVRKIVNYGNRTFFVHVVEKDPTAAPLNPATKNPWSGGMNP